MGNVKTKVFLGYLVLIALSSLIVWIIYSELPGDSTREADQPQLNEKIIYINSILTNLYQLESLGRNYAQSGQMKPYREYQKLMDEIRGQIDTLAGMAEDTVQQVYTDSIKQLLREKHKNLRELSAIKHANSPAARFEQVIERLSADSFLRHPPVSISQIPRINKTVTTNYDSIYVKQKRKKFFERLANVFSARKQKDSALYVSVNQTVQLDSLIHAATPADSISDYLTNLIEEIRDENLAMEKKLRQQELKVLDKDLDLTMQLRRLLANIENAELLNSLHQLKAQQEKIRQTTWLIIALGALSLFTIIFFLINILKDLSKSKHYRQSLEKANAYSESLLHSKEQFMLSITHDLKSPLSSIIGFTGLIGESTDNPRQKQYLRRIRQASDHILRLINDLLDLARLDSGKLTIEHHPFNLKSLVTDAVENFRPLAIEKNIGLKCAYFADSTGYRSDPVRITQILVNLISNAVKFTDQGSVTVSVRSERISKKTDHVFLEVSDTGIGIPPEKIQYIFEEFGRVTSTAKQYEGTGLGLTITRKIVHLLHGSVSVKSHPGEGSQFTVSLPMEREEVIVPPNRPEPATVSSVDSIKSLEGKRVWLVDDDQTLLEMTTKILELSGLKVTAFRNPQAAVSEFKKGCADFLITDIQMPGMNGFDVFVRIREKNDGYLPAIAMSGQAIDQTQWGGFSAFIQKPFSPMTLINALYGHNGHSVRQEKADLSSVNTGQSYNLEQIAAFASGDEETLRQIIVSFIQSSRQNTDLLRKFHREKNQHALSELAHKMLPLFRQLEAHPIVELLAVLEQRNTPALSAQQLYALALQAADQVDALMNTIQQEEGLPLIMDEA